MTLKPQKRRIVCLPTGRSENSLGFLRFFVFFNLAQFHYILTLFTQVMVSKASVAKASATNYDVKTRHWGLKG